jgi:hypothetical protein
MRYPYREIAKGLLAPIVELQIWSSGKWVDLDAYVDSGATYTIFGSDTAEILGINLRSGRRMMIRVGDGKLMPVYLHRLPVQFSGHKFTATIGFSESLGVGFNILGRISFFDRFRVCFNDKERVIDTTFLE